MKINLNKNKKNIFILGAGASIEYGLPNWKDLNIKIREEIKNDIENKYEYKKKISEWLDKVGDDREYKTIDEAIKHESVSEKYKDNGDLIEDELFEVIKAILINNYQENDEGWIRHLNDYIFSTNHELEKETFFINYNYDDVFYKNFLNTNHLTSKHKNQLYKIRIDGLSNINLEILCPHGILINDNSKFNYNYQFIINTNKTNNKLYKHDACSCHDSKDFTIDQKTYLIPNGTSRPLIKRDLYILGLGGGLEVNLNKINFKDDFDNNSIIINNIYITITTKERDQEIKTYLKQKFKITDEQIRIYRSCKELIQNVFVMENT